MCRMQHADQHSFHTNLDNLEGLCQHVDKLHHSSYCYCSKISFLRKERKNCEDTTLCLNNIHHLVQISSNVSTFCYVSRRVRIRISSPGFFLRGSLNFPTASNSLSSEYNPTVVI